MARVVPEDPFGGLAQEAQFVDPAPLDLVDVAEPDTPALVARAAAAEESALAVPGVTNSEGAEASYGRLACALVTSAGFAGRFSRTSHSLSATALAGEGTGMQRDYDFTSAVHLADLEDAALRAHGGERAVTRLNPIVPKRRSCRWSMIRVSRRDCWAICSERSMGPPWRGAPPS